MFLFFKRGFAEMPPLLAVALCVPKVLLGPVFLGIFGFLGRDTAICRNLLAPPFLGS